MGKTEKEKKYEAVTAASLVVAAIEENDVKTFQENLQTLKTLDKNYSTEELNKLLVKYCIDNDNPTIEMLKSFIENGADITYKLPYGDSLQCLLFIGTKPFEITKFVIGCYEQQYKAEGKNPQEELKRLLNTPYIKEDNECALTNIHYLTHVALNEYVEYKGKSPTVELLLQKGADPNITDKQNRKSFHYAIDECKKDQEPCWYLRPLLKDFIRHGLILNNKDWVQIEESLNIPGSFYKVRTTEQIRQETKIVMDDLKDFYKKALIERKKPSRYVTISKNKQIVPAAGISNDEKTKYADRVKSGSGKGDKSSGCIVS